MMPMRKRGAAEDRAALTEQHAVAVDEGNDAPATSPPRCGGAVVDWFSASPTLQRFVRSSWSVWAALVLVQLIFAVNINAVRYAVHFVDPFVLITLRELVATCVLVSVAHSGIDRRSHAHRLSGADWRWLVAAGLTGVLGHLGLVSYGIKRTSAVTATFFATTRPLFATIAAIGFGLESLAWHRVAGFVCGVLGIAIALEALWHPGQIFRSNRTDGYLALFASNCCYGCYLVLLKLILRRSVPLLLALSRIFYVGLVGLLVVGAFRVHTFGALAHAPLGVWLAGLWAGAIVSPIPYSLNGYAVQRCSPVVAAIFSNLEPPITATIAVLWLREHVTYAEVAGFVIVAAGVVLAAMGERAGEAAAPATSSVGEDAGGGELQPVAVGAPAVDAAPGAGRSPPAPATLTGPERLSVTV